MERRNKYNQDDVFKDLVERPKEAMQEIHELYRDTLYAFVRLYLQDDDLIDDVIQETLLVVWSKRADAVKLEKPYFWMQRIAKYQAIQKIREMQKHNKVPLEESCELSERDKADAMFMLKEIEQQIQEAMEGLTPIEREIFMESRFGGCSNQEMADRHNLAEQTVKNKLSKALKIIRERLKHLLTLFI